ncbi:MAG: hypothetical protein U0744_19605 [Gemmataceae bacterium]
MRDGRNPVREKVVVGCAAGEVEGRRSAQAPCTSRKSTLGYTELRGEGQEVGPDLTGNGRSDFEQLLSTTS